MSKVKKHFPTDLPILAHIHEACFGQAAWSLGSFEGLVLNPCVDILVFKNEAHEILGFVAYHIVVDEGEVLTIAVRPDCLRQKIASHLMAEMFLEMRGQGVRRIFLEVAENNLAAIGLYSALGFEFTGKRLNYYQSGDALTAEKIL